MGSSGESSSSDDEETVLQRSNNNELLTINEVIKRQKSYGTVVSLPEDCCQQNGQPQDNSGKWSAVVWIIFTYLCVFWHRTITNKRKCYACYVRQVTKERVGGMNKSLLLDPICLQYEYDGKEWMNGNGLSGNGLMDTADDDVKECDVCNVTFWDYYGVRRRYTDESIGVSPWVFRISKVTSFCGLLIAIGLILYEVGYYVQKMWGRQDKLLHFISYNAFLVCISVYPVMGLCSKMRSIFGRSENAPFLEWASSLNARFIVKRLQILNLSERGLPGKFILFASLTWPLSNSLFRAYIYTFLIRSSRHHLDVHAKISICSTGLLLLMWGCFVYLIYVMRISFQRQFMLMLCYLKKNEGSLDLCRDTLSHVVMDFNCFRRCTVIYMATMVPLTVLGVTTNISWQYILAGSCYKLEDSQVERSINILIWSNIISGITLSCVAVGGLDLNYVWNHFTTSVLQMQSYKHSHFWSKIVNHLRDLGGEQPALSLTIVWSIIGFYMGIHFGDDQDVFYGGTKCLELNITKATGIIGYSTY